MHVVLFSLVAGNESSVFGRSIPAQFRLDSASPHAL